MISHGNGNTNDDDPDLEDEGGLGGGTLRPKGARDTRLLERAAREKWPVKPEYRERIVARQVDIATSGECSPREQTSAAKFLLECDKFNVDSEREHGPHTLIQAVGEVKVVTDANWYGNADRLPPDAS